MLTGLKVSSLACKYVFYGPELNTKGEPPEWNSEGLEMKHTTRKSSKIR